MATNFDALMIFVNLEIDIPTLDGDNELIPIQSSSKKKSDKNTIYKDLGPPE